MTKVIEWSFHADESQGNHKYKMMIVCEIFFKLQVDLCFYDNKIRSNGVAYTGYKTQMKDVTIINFYPSSTWLQDEAFRNK